jgi:uncharacterized protein YecE (DUF72 family)
MSSPQPAANWFIGTMGFSYADWTGVFYPADMPPQKRLSYYSRVFNAVEIDSTFYGAPRPENVRRWAAATTLDFRFCLKVPRQLTHEAGLVGVQGDLLKFIDTIQLLDEKLGALLFQFPPSIGPDRLPALQACLAGLPPGLRYAVETRHPAWYETEDQLQREPALAQALRALGVCWAATEYPGLPRRIYPTADFLYLRWIGQHGTFQRHDQERIERGPQLREWQHIIHFVQGEGKGQQEIFGFFNNDYAGFAAATANRFKELEGLPVMPLRPARQGTLF